MYGKLPTMHKVSHGIISRCEVWNFTSFSITRIHLVEAKLIWRIMLMEGIIPFWDSMSGSASPARLSRRDGLSTYIVMICRARNGRAVIHHEGKWTRDEAFCCSDLRRSGKGAQPGSGPRGETHDVESIAADTKSECKVIHQAVNNALLTEQCLVLVVNVPGRV